MKGCREAAALGDLSVLAGLASPVRRRLYELVSDAGRGVGRDEAAASAGISRSLAAFHLDRLVEYGLLEAGFERRRGSSGPGAGRPAKYYRRAQRELVLRVPPRDYRLLSELLVRAASTTRGTFRTNLNRVSRDVGRELAAHADAAGDEARISAVLRARGYEPYEEATGTIRLRNCPFLAIARTEADLVCGLNLALIEGMLDGLGADHLHARLEPSGDGCCVAIAPTTTRPELPGDGEPNAA